MARLTRPFPGFRDPLACAALLLATGLYTAALFLPSLRAADPLVLSGVGGRPTGVGNEVVLDGRETLLYAWYSVVPLEWPDRVFDTEWWSALREQWGENITEMVTPPTWTLWNWFLRAFLANPLLALGMLALAAGRRHLPWVLGALALISGASLELWRCEFDGCYSPHHLWAADQVGSYLWLASMAVLTAAGAYRARWPRNRARPDS